MVLEARGNGRKSTKAQRSIVIILPVEPWAEKHGTGHLTLSMVGREGFPTRRFQKAKSRKMIRKSI